MSDVWDPRSLHRADCETASYNAGPCDCDGAEVLAEVTAWRAKAARLREMCDRADRLDPFDQDAYNLGTVDVRAVLDS